MLVGYPEGFWTPSKRGKETKDYFVALLRLEGALYRVPHEKSRRQLSMYRCAFVALERAVREMDEPGDVVHSVYRDVDFYDAIFNIGIPPLYYYYSEPDIRKYIMFRLFRNQKNLLAAAPEDFMKILNEILDKISYRLQCWMLASDEDRKAGLELVKTDIYRARNYTNVSLK